VYLNVIQLAESLGVEESVVEGWMRHENLPFLRDSGRLLFDRTQVAAWAAERGLAAKAGFLAPAESASRQGIQLESMLVAGGIWRNVEPQGVSKILEQIVERMSGVSPDIRRMLAKRVGITEGITWAPVGEGLAFPHLRSHVALGRGTGVLAMVFLSGPLAGAETRPDDAPITRLLFFIAPSPRTHLELLARLSSALRDPALRKLVMEAAPDEELMAVLKRLDEAAARGPAVKGALPAAKGGKG
jgi:PTS system nitrogen regulatory IIA component